MAAITAQIGLVYYLCAYSVFFLQVDRQEKGFEHSDEEERDW